MDINEEETTLQPRPNLTTVTYEQVGISPAPAGARVTVILNGERYVLPILCWGLFIATFKSNLNPTWSDTCTLPMTYFPLPGRKAQSLDYVQEHQFVGYDFENVK